MTEFPALRDALVGAATRRRRRRRAAGAAVPLFASVAAAVVLIAVSGQPREREAPPVVAPKPALSPLEQAFAVFRRPQRPQDVLPHDALRGDVDRARSRLVGRAAGVRIFVVPVVMHGKATLCTVAVGSPATAAGCAPLPKGAIPADFASGLETGAVYALVLPDGAHDIALTRSDRTTITPQPRDNGVVVPESPMIGTAAWTGASGTRYTKRNEFAPEVTAPPRRCPAKLDPLPAQAIERARSVALMAAGSLYPYADEAAVVDTVRPAGTPCSKAITERSIEVSLHLTPRSVKARKSASLSQGRLLLGVIDGQMTVYYFLH